MRMLGGMGVVSCLHMCRYTLQNKQLCCNEISLMLELNFCFLSKLLVAAQLCLLLCQCRRLNLMLSLDDVFLLPLLYGCSIVL
jgi:hypothetical protein